MHRGSMVVKVLEKGKFVDVPIAEGEVLLLPGRIPHSPQRFENTVGLVIERERDESEKDCLRWYVPNQEKPESLYEAFFHCVDLGVQLKPVIEEFYASEQKKTGKPVVGTILDVDKVPVSPDPTLSVPKPFPLKAWIDEHRHKISTSPSGHAAISDSGEFNVQCFCGSASNNTVHKHAHEEAWIWQWTGSTEVKMKVPHLSNPAEAHESITLLNEQDCFLIPTNMPYTLHLSKDSITLVIRMIPMHRK